MTYANIGKSGDYRIDDLLYGRAWDKGGAAVLQLSYSFPATAAGYAPGYAAGEPLTGFAALTDAQQAAVASAMAAWSAVANVRFVPLDETEGGTATVRTAWTRVPDILDAQAYAYGPGSSAAAGDIWLNPDARWVFSPGGYGYMTLVHELGHVLGLSHPFSGGIGGSLPAAEDVRGNTVMSYTNLAGKTETKLSTYPTTPMSYDIAAIQYLYGANTGYHSGDDVYTFSQGSSYYQTLWDGGGNDTIVWSIPGGAGLGQPQPATIDLRPGHWSSLGNALSFTDSGGHVLATDPRTVQIYASVTIENAVGARSNDELIGNDAANLLDGGGGDDRLSGNAGNDTLLGGAGWDQALYAGPRSAYTLLRDGAALLVVDQAGTDGSDRLLEVERLQFADGSYAIDMAADQAGGEVALLSGALWGRAGLADGARVGQLLSHLSANPALATLAEGASYALGTLMGRGYVPGPEYNQWLVSLLYKNIVGTDIDAGTLQVFAGLLDSQALTAAQLVAAAALLPQNLTNVDLVGLAAQGLAYTPYTG